MEKLGFGGAPLGNLFDVVPEESAAETMRTAWACGVRFYDTAPLYGFGLSEHRMGAALRVRPRDEYRLSTKVGRLLGPEKQPARERLGFVDSMPFRPVFDYSYAAAIRSVEDSLQRLGLARVDTVLIHDVGEDTHGAEWRGMFDAAMAGAARALTELRRDGTIASWGLGVNRVEPCLMALEAAEPDVFLVAGRYTLLDQAALSHLMPRCTERGARIIVGGPFNSGLLAGGGTYDYVAAPAELVARAKRLGEICGRHGVDLRAAALQFCAAHPVVSVVIPGARNPAEVQSNASLMAAPIPAPLWDEFRAEGLIPDAAPTPS